jgi:hypothetical protein
MSIKLLTWDVLDLPFSVLYTTRCYFFRIFKVIGDLA